MGLKDDDRDVAGGLDLTALVVLRLRAWSRCQPVVAHNSSRITTFAPLDADRYRVAAALVTALRWLIVSPMFEAGPTPTVRPHRHAAGGHS